MASITIRNLDDVIKRRLRIRAAEHGRSMEEEVRSILRAALREVGPSEHGLGSAIHERFTRLRGLELELPPREPMRPPPGWGNHGQ